MSINGSPSSAAAVSFREAPGASFKRSAAAASKVTSSLNLPSSVAGHDIELATTRWQGDEEESVPSPAGPTLMRTHSVCPSPSAPPPKQPPAWQQNLNKYFDKVVETLQQDNKGAQLQDSLATLQRFFSGFTYSYDTQAWQESENKEERSSFAGVYHSFTEAQLHTILSSPKMALYLCTNEEFWRGMSQCQQAGVLGKIEFRIFKQPGIQEYIFEWGNNSQSFIALLLVNNENNYGLAGLLQAGFVLKAQAQSLSKEAQNYFSSLEILDLFMRKTITFEQIKKLTVRQFELVKKYHRLLRDGLAVLDAKGNACPNPNIARAATYSHQASSAAAAKVAPFPSQPAVSYSAPAKKGPPSFYTDYAYASNPNYAVKISNSVHHEVIAHLEKCLQRGLLTLTQYKNFSAEQMAYLFSNTAEVKKFLQGEKSFSSF